MQLHFVFPLPPWISKRELKVGFDDLAEIAEKVRESQRENWKSSTSQPAAHIPQQWISKRELKVEVKAQKRALAEEAESQRENWKASWSSRADGSRSHPESQRENWKSSHQDTDTADSPTNLKERIESGGLAHDLPELLGYRISKRELKVIVSL